MLPPLHFGEHELISVPQQVSVVHTDPLAQSFDVLHGTASSQA
ncbi:MAG TPA: hypothetical protein VEM41_13190 [Actinomycetota bacterium]|jgi:hypothetical protein|nr:hypothetical protein [Actinomycetota bacterium]